MLTHAMRGTLVRSTRFNCVCSNPLLFTAAQPVPYEHDYWRTMSNGTFLLAFDFAQSAGRRDRQSEAVHIGVVGQASAQLAYWAVTVRSAAGQTV